MSIDRDLTRWEDGLLSRKELEARHPGVDALGLTAVRDRLTTLADVPPPDVEVGWATLAATLPSPPRHVVRLRRTLVLAAAALLAMGTVAYAAGFDPVVDGVDRVVKGISGIFGSEVLAPAPSERERPRDPATGPADAGDEHGRSIGGGSGGEDGDSSGPSSSGGSGGDEDDSGSGSSGSGSGSGSSGSGSSGSGSGESDSSGSGSEGSDSSGSGSGDSSGDASTLTDPG